MVYNPALFSCPLDCRRIAKIAAHHFDAKRIQPSRIRLWTDKRPDVVPFIG
jgi:hypothetical protein